MGDLVVFFNAELPKLMLLNIVQLEDTTKKKYHFYSRAITQPKIIQP